MLPGRQDDAQIIQYRASLLPHEATRALESRPYMPHLSVLYEDIAEERKRTTVDALGIQMPLTLRIEAAELWADRRVGVPSWYRVARVPFSRMHERKIHKVAVIVEMMAKSADTSHKVSKRCIPAALA